MDPPPPPRGRGRAGRTVPAPIRARGRGRGRGRPAGSLDIATPSSASTSGPMTGLMTPITPAAAFPIGMSPATPGSAISQTSSIGSVASRGGSTGPARRAVVAPRFRGRRTAEERAALAQAERARFGADLAAKSKAEKSDRGRGRGRGVRGRDSGRGRGNRESRWTRGGGRVDGADPTASLIVPSAPDFDPINTGGTSVGDAFVNQHDMIDINQPDIHFPPAPDSSDDSEDDHLGPCTDVGQSDAFTASRPAGTVTGLTTALNPLRISRTETDGPTDSEIEFGRVATALSAASRERPPPPVRRWKGVFQDSDESEESDVDDNSEQPANPTLEENDNDETESDQPVFRTIEHRDEYFRLRRSRARLVALLANKPTDTTVTEQSNPIDSDPSEPTSKSTPSKHVSFVDPGSSDPGLVKSEPGLLDSDDLMSDIKPEDDKTPIPSTSTTDPRADRLFLFQFPPLLPRLLPKHQARSERVAATAAAEKARLQNVAIGSTSGPTDSTDQSESTNAGFPPPHDWFSPELSSGKAGKLRVHKSGKVTLQFGGNKFLVHEGIDVDFLQTGMVVKLPKEKKVKKEKKDVKGKGKAKLEPGLKKESMIDIDLSNDEAGPDGEEEEEEVDDEVGAYSMGPISGKFVTSVYWENTLGKESSLFMSR